MQQGKSLQNPQSRGPGVGGQTGRASFTDCSRAAGGRRHTHLRTSLTAWALPSVYAPPETPFVSMLPSSYHFN